MLKEKKGFGKIASNRTMTDHEHILLFDGVCTLCNRLVQFITKRDKKAKIRFVSLQSESGQSLLRKLGLSTEVFDSVVYISGDRYFLKSSAILHMLNELEGIWKLSVAFIIIPKFIRDFVYNIIAKKRYKISDRSS